MAHKILFKVDQLPAGVNNQFYGRNPFVENAQFNRQAYQEAIYFVDRTQCMIDKNKNPAGMVQHPVEVWKVVDRDTPLFKECCHRSLVIPKMSFYFFERLEGDSEYVNHFIIEMEDALVIQDTITLYDISNPHDPENGAYSIEKEKPYVEKLHINARLVRWKFQRTQEPLAATGATQLESV